MKATGTRFSNLLQGQQHFVVPLFQRLYTCREGNWRTLFDDVLEVYEEGRTEERHFVGSIVTKSLGATPSGVAPFLVIDGQQRLTPRTLLLAALRDVVKEGNPELTCTTLWRVSSCKPSSTMSAPSLLPYQCLTLVARSVNSNPIARQACWGTGRDSHLDPHCGHCIYCARCCFSTMTI